MKLLNKHITIEFTKVFTMTLISLVALFLMVEMVEKIDDLMEENVPLQDSVLYFILKLPFIISQVAPIATLMSVLLSLGLLNKHNEFSVIKSAGIDLNKTFTPIFMIGIVISFSVFLLNEWINPLSTKKLHIIEDKYLENDAKGFFGSKGLWLSTGNSIINIKAINIKDKSLSGLTVYLTDEKKHLKTKTYAKKVKWVNDSHWLAETVFITEKRANNITYSYKKENLNINNIGRPENLLGKNKHYKELNFAELKQYIRELEHKSIDANTEKIELYGKLSFPIINFIMVIIAIPFAISTGRKTAIAEGVAISTVIGFSYWIVYGITSGLGQKGLLSPIWAAFYPTILFLALGGFLFTYLKR